MLSFIFTTPTILQLFYKILIINYLGVHILISTHVSINANKGGDFRGA